MESIRALLRLRSTSEWTTEFEISGSGTDIPLLVWTSGLLGAAVALSVFASLGTIAGTGSSGGTGTLRLRTGSALQRRRHNLRGQMQVRPQVLNALVGQIPVVVAPGELLLDEVLRLQRLHRLDDVQVRDGFQLRVLRSIEVLLGYENSLLEEVLVDGDATWLLSNTFQCKQRKVFPIFPHNGQSTPEKEDQETTWPC